MVESKDGKTEIISKEEKFWRDVKEASKEKIGIYETEIKTLRRMIKASDVMIDIEKSK